MRLFFSVVCVAAVMALQFEARMKDVQWLGEGIAEAGDELGEIASSVHEGFMGPVTGESAYARRSKGMSLDDALKMCAAKADCRTVQNIH